jgi:hypothetical protein
MPQFAATTEGKQPLGAATRETVLQLRGTANKLTKIRKWGVSFFGVTSDAVPVLVELERQSSDGTSGTACTERAVDETDPSTAQTTAHTNFSASGTSSAILEQHAIHPQGGKHDAEYILGKEIVLDAATTSRLAITCTAPAAVDCVAYIVWDE